MRRLLSFVCEEEGTTAVEYAVMLSLIVVVCLGALMSLGTATAGSFTTSRDAIMAAMGN